MYSLNSNSRRITTYVQEEAHKWLYNKIIKNEYDVGSNRKAQKLIIDIKKEGKVTAESYDRFVSKVIYNPFDVVTRGYKSCSKKYICARAIENFFLKYNGVILPIGFVKDFFEDDYETQAEINKYIESVVKGQEEKFAIKCQEKLLNQTGNIADMKDDKPYVFRTKIMFHITNILKAILTIATLVVCLKFIVGEDVITKIIEYNRDGAHEEFFDTYMFHVIFNFIVLIFLIPRVIKLIKTIIFYIRWLAIRIRVFMVGLSIKQFEANKFGALREYFKSIVPEIATTHVISEEACKNVPAARRQYVAIDEFDFEKVENQIVKLYNSPRLLFLNACYNEEDERVFKQKKKSWRKRIVASTLLLAILCFTNIQSCRDFAMEILEPVIEYITGEEFGDDEEVSVFGENAINVAEKYSYISSPAFRGTVSGSNATWNGDSTAVPTYPDEDSKSLNDGKMATTSSKNDSAWVGFHDSAPYFAFVGYHTLTFDLKKEVEISGVSAYVGTSDLSYVSAPDTIEVWISNDGLTYTMLADATPTNETTEEDTATERVDIVASGKGKYVQIRFKGDGWLFLSEVEIYSEDSNAISGTDSNASDTVSDSSSQVSAEASNVPISESVSATESE